MFTVFIYLCVYFSYSGAEIHATSSPENSFQDLPPELEMIDYIYQKSIYSVQFHKEGNVMGPPFLKLGDGLSLTLSFDDLDADFKDYYYTIIHCDANWNVSDLYQSDYLDGFRELDVSLFDNSYNTKVPFTHYRIQFPSVEMSPKISGNYLIYVYADNDMNQPALTRRFVVYEEVVRFRARVKEPTKISEIRYGQEVDFDLIYAEHTVDNPYMDLDVVILQNNRWDNAIHGLQPKFVKDRELTFDYDEENNFPGGNEFRWVDLKDREYVSDEVRRIYLGRDNIYHVELFKDEKRTFKSYRSDRDINGRFLIRNDRGDDDVLENDYFKVHFVLPFEQPFRDESVYIFGDLSMFQYLPRFRMTYDSKRRAYVAKVLMKQGYYNYCYSVYKEGDAFGDITRIEGSHFETENEYTIFAYDYDINLGYDRVIGAFFTDSYNR